MAEREMKAPGESVQKGGDAGFSYADKAGNGVTNEALLERGSAEHNATAEYGVTEYEDKPGRYGGHGGQYIPETLMNEVTALEKSYLQMREDPQFQAELGDLLRNYAGRPSLLYYARAMSEDLGGARIYLKREDLNHTGSHKINNVLGQVLLAKKMGKTRIIAETGAGQHGVAAATAAALLGLQCEIFMGREDTVRQALNVYRMELLGASVHPVDSGTATLKDAVNECMREWTRRVDDTAYVLGSVMGPHPFPMMVRDFQRVISREAREQILEAEGKLPDAVLACVGGGSNAMGMFYEFIPDESVQLIGCEAAGRGIHTGKTAATIATGTEGIFHGMKSYFCQNDEGQIAPVYSISAGLDYPGIGPEHAWLHDIGRAQYVAITDEEAVEAFEYIACTEGIVAAIESAHAIAQVMKMAPQMRRDQVMICCLSGRGDKDVAAIARYRGKDIHE
ncbi:MAG: tryptophan synthase subunit beta [Actinomycetaceae bacterium]|nr:tryptophan synthase subunit beta [Actinomycetaceae bacterium]